MVECITVRIAASVKLAYQTLKADWWTLPGRACPTLPNSKLHQVQLWTRRSSPEFNSTQLSGNTTTSYYDRGSSTILRFVVVVQPQLDVLYVLAMRARKIMNVRRVHQARMTTSSDMLLTQGDCR